MPFYTRSSTERRQRGSSHIAQRSASAATMVRIVGGPDPRYISTSYIERQNLTMRTSNMMYYNFERKRLTLGTTPALKAGSTDHVWSVEEIIGLLERNRPAELSSHAKLKLNH